MRRTALSLLMAMAIMVALASGALARQVKIEFWTESLAPFEKYIKATIERFEKENPDITVVWVDKAGKQLESFLTAAAAGTAPDVINLNVGDTFRMSQAGGALNLNPYMSQADKDIYFKGLYESLIFDDGGTYGLPWYVTTRVAMYNADIFEKAGIDPNKPPETWDKVSEYAKLIKQRTGVYGYQPPIDPGQFIQDLRMFGIPPVKAGKANIASPEAIARLAWFVDHIKQDWFPQDWETGFRGSWDKYMAGKLAMAITGATLLPQVKSKSPDIYEVTRIAPMPRGPGNVVPVAMFAINVPSMSKNKEAAVKFAKYFTNDENQLAWAKFVGTVLPSTKKAAGDPFFNEPNKDIDARARYIMMQQLFRATDMTLTVKGEKDLLVTLQGFMREAMAGKTSPKVALEQAAEQWNRILSGK